MSSVTEGTGRSTAKAGSGFAMDRLARPEILFIPALLILVPVYLMPVLDMMRGSFGEEGWSLALYHEALTNQAFLVILWRTLTLSAQVTVLVLLFGYPIAYMIVRAPEKQQKWLLLLLALPLWTSALVRSFAWVVLLGRQGMVNDVATWIGLQTQPTQLLYNRGAVLVGFVHVMLPYVVFPLVSVMKRIPDRLTFTGRTLGAGRMTAFWTIFFPLSLPGVVSGGVLTFVLTIGYFVTPALLGGLSETTYVMLIQQQVETAFNWPLASAMSVVLLAVTLAIVAIFWRFIGTPDETAGRAGTLSRIFSGAVTTTVVQASRLAALLPTRGSAYQAERDRKAGAAIRIFVWVLLLFVLLPILILFPLGLSSATYLQFPPPGWSLRWYINYFSRADWLASTWVSFQVALSVMVIATAIGTAAAVAIHRASPRYSAPMRGLMVSPLVVPTIVIAIAIYFQYAKLQLIGSVFGLTLAHCIVAMPIVVIIVEGALKRARTGPERAARSLGASAVRAFLSTTFVTIRPSIITAALFAFLTSFDDVVIALFLAGVNPTLPKRMWDGVNLEIDPTLAAVSSILILVSVAVVLAVQGVTRATGARSDQTAG